MNTNKVFVYGTLMPGQSAHGVLKEYVNTMRLARVHGFRMYGKHSGFPCVKPTDSEDDVVYGWTVTVTDIDEALHHLDIYEGHPTLFKREVVNSVIDDTIVPAWIYVGQYDNPGELIESGDWR